MGTKVTYQKRLPWVDNKLKLEIRKKNQLFLTYKKKSNTAKFNILQKSKEICKQRIKESTSQLL